MAARIGTLLATVALLLLLTPTAAQAHGGADVTIHTDGHGSVWITAQWQDGHPISEPTQVTLTATGDTTTLPASALRQTGDERGTQTYSGTLAPGAWRVSIDLAAPVNGHCQALIQSAPESAPPHPAEIACLIPATAPTPAEPPEPASNGSLTPLWFTLAALATAATAMAVYLHRRRRP
ncbi:hypothetical protein [Dactylosporangium sp. CA-233914]|uniref:hypothetical protein n=1 Tax=Dactylosporangium sp. CA-233914 TaxID=3239934 RepID=UPI003D91B9E1